MELYNFAIDFGNGYVKAMSDKENFIIPAKLAYNHDLGTASLDGLFDDQHDINTFQRKEEPAYVFGKDIEKAISPNKIISTNSNNNRYKLKTFKQLVDFSLAELASKEEINNETEDGATFNIRLVTGMPSGDMRKQELKGDFESFLKGYHVITRNGIDYAINVKELKIIEQPLGTLLNVFLNDDLRVHKTLKEGLVVVIDFGSGTTIVDIYKNMKRIGGKTLQNGMIQFNRSIADWLSEQKSIDVEAEFVEQGILDKSYIAEFGQQRISFKEIFDSILKQKIQTIIQTYENEIGQEELVNDFVITGGGSLVIGDQLREEKPDFRVVENPQLSTSHGYYKLAQSLGKADQ